jgi:dienelactone hydrolase
LRNIDARRLLHREAFVVGSTLSGLEVQQAAAVGAYFKNRSGLPLDLYGGWTALLTAATEPLFDSANIIRDWNQDPSAEPVDRLIYGQALQFGADDLVRLAKPAKVHIAEGEPSLLPASKPGRSFDDLHEFLRRKIQRSEQIRESYWNLKSSPQQAARLRKELENWMGVPRVTPEPLKPSLRLLRITADFKAWEVRIPVTAGLDAVGHLLVPRKTGVRMPAVIAQHGLGGAPKDITGIGEQPDKVYHEFGAKLAERGYVVFAPYITVPIPQAELINPMVRRAASAGMMRTAVEVMKLRRIVDYLETRPDVDAQHIGYYGLSYGGYSAIWMAPLEPRLRAVVVSGHFNDWREKITNLDLPTSYLFHPDEDFFNWDVLHRFTHVELIAAMHPRPVMIEYADGDTTTTPAWHERAWSQLAELARSWNMEDKWVRDHFSGAHEIGGMRTFEFLDRWLKPEQPSSRTYSYRLWPSTRDLPGLADSAADTYPYIETVLGTQTLKDTFRVGHMKNVFTGMKLRLSRAGPASALTVRFGSSPGSSDLGEVRIEPPNIHPLYDLWYEARVPPRRLEPGREYHVQIQAERGEYVLYAPKPLGGKPLPEAFPFAYQLIGTDHPGIEPTFEFVREYLSPLPPINALPYRIRSDLRHPAVQQALSRFPKSDAAGVRTLRLEQRDAVDGVNTPEGFRADVQGQDVAIRATTARGIMRGLYWLEDALLSPGGPTNTVRNERFPRRITTSILPGGQRYTESSRPFLYTDGLLQRISRDGFNGIWIWLNTEEAAFDSAVFPELNDPLAPDRLRQIQELSDRASRFGVDVYVYLATGYHHFIPQSFYDKYPELKGVGFGSPMCTSDTRVRKYHAEIVGNLFRRAPAIRGMVVIYDHEGFYYCGNTERSRERCPRCRHRTNVDLALEVIGNLNDAMLDNGRSEHEFIAWSYGTEDWVDRVIPGLPKNIKVQVDFSKGGTVVRDGITHVTGDYNLTLIGPPDFFERRNRLSRELGLEFITKTEHAVSQEFIFVPYIPAMEQWLRRIEKIRAYPAAGWFGNWSHYGYMASLPARLINRMSFDPVPPRDEILRELATLEYGAGAAPQIVQAWNHFSGAIRQFPYSDNVSRLPGPLQKGPSQPFFLDPKVKSFGRWRAWQNDLEWTAPWGPKVTAKYLAAVCDGFKRGAALLRKAEASAATATHRRRIAADWRIARVIEASLQSTLHQIEWLQFRDRFLSGETTVFVNMQNLLRAELANARAVLPLLDADSRLGYASEGGGVLRGGLFSPELVRWKIGQVEDVLSRQLPEAHRNQQ